ncbi:MAG: hypothetical protein HY897_23295 [Deltaproteobacteria bacterium]|nr:hypothetical protein [Deltaproteobacteria bacterium]
MRGLNSGKFLLPAAAVLLLATVSPGCDSREADNMCEEPTIEPHLSPVNFGDLYTTEDGGTGGGGAQTVPYEWVLLLMSKCKEAVTVTAACFAGTTHSGAPANTAFFVEGPVPAAIEGGKEAAVRITYSPSAPNADTNGDGVPDPDNVALVVQSNAKNYPTLVVPICARLVAAGTERTAFECTSPVTLAPGAKDETLCQ